MEARAHSYQRNGGYTWEQPVLRAKGFVDRNAKIWGQRLSDGTYATVYNPSEFRWPLAISLSKDGLEYTTLNLVHGEITPMRYGGNYKSYGPQYPRGIQEGNGIRAKWRFMGFLQCEQGRYVDFPHSCSGRDKCFSTCGR